MKYLQSLDPVVLVVVGVLIAISILSWAIIVYKLWETGAVRRADRQFQRRLWDEQGSVVDGESAGELRWSAAARLYAEARKVKDGRELSSEQDELLPVTLRGDFGRRLRRMASIETDRLDRNVALLATAASTAPFIGLFGTVWGIMVAFRNIGAAGSTSLDIVAPGIAQALITTAVGLAVAIPAAVGYNLLQERIRNIVNEIDRFCEDLIAAARTDSTAPVE